MIKKLTNDDKLKCLDFLYQEPEYNIFPIGDIEAYGFEEDFQQVYGEFDQEMNLLSILLFYRKNMIYYAPNHRLNLEYMMVIQRKSFQFFSGKTVLLELFEPYLPGFKRRTMFFCKADKIIETLDIEGVVIKELKTREEAGRLHRLLVGIDDFNISQDKEACIRNKMISMNMGKRLFIERDGKIVSSVATTAKQRKVQWLLLLRQIRHIDI